MRSKVTFAFITRMKRAFVMAVLVCVMAGLAQAQRGGGMMNGGELPSTTLPPNLGNVTIEQKLNEQLPLDVPFRDEAGKTVTLREYFKPGRPVLLNLVYYDCPMLCTEVLNGVTGVMRLLKFDAGKEYEVVTVSFDAREKPQLAAAKKKVYMQRYGRPQAAGGWHFLTGDQSSIDVLTNAAGFHYQWDEKLQQFAHASAIMVATPEGKLSHYFYGVEYSPKDVRLALVEASSGKIGNPVDQVLLYCYHYDPRTGKYGAVITNVLRVAGAITVLILGSFLVIMFRRDRKASREYSKKGEFVGSR